MSNFIQELEDELRAASGRSLRLMVARTPRPPATILALAVSAAVCVAVAVAVLAGHTTSGPSVPGSRPSRSHTPASRNHATPRVHRASVRPGSLSDPVLEDCVKHGRLTRRYTTRELQRASRTMPASIREYTACPQDITRALALAAQPVHHGTPHRAARPGDPVLKDCVKHGRLTGQYPIDELQHALKTMPASIREYTACVIAIKHALHDR